MDVELAPITDDDITDVSRFMHDHHNRGVAPERWSRALRTRWSASAPHHGYLLRADGRIVGAYLAYFSDREIDGRIERFCNLGAWCVLEPHRAQGLRLLMALLRMRGYHFTDLSPSGSVIALNRALKFAELDTTTSIMVNLPWRSARRDVRISSDPAVVRATLSGAERQIYADHEEAAAARHLVVMAGDEHCYVIFRRDQRKRIRAFASILYVGNADLFRVAARQVGGHLLLHHGIAATLMEQHVIGDRPRWAVALERARPKMFKSSTLPADRIDYLYSELVGLEW
ncbi:hypothetical protein L332_08840 [Agrococcus pavilionensis RW1]|uniref:N-acetyltransferase domain-containing protein n=1 Tax=Agrococcus pavilionensis RW1 TaxID=1330458 RepID=U1LR67_9MICO|nr:hypothetical protein [Agrococcus pavilionensis]ERG64552.1 hypothetical protein L332_08840 [Agrococcus pavilionensis RW1]